MILKELKFTGNFEDLKFLKGSKDPFCEGTLYKALGSGTFLLIRQNRDIKIREFDIISSKPDKLKPLLEKLGIPFEEVEVEMVPFTEESEDKEEREDDLEWQER